MNRPGSDGGLSHSTATRHSAADLDASRSRACCALEDRGTIPRNRNGVQPAERRLVAATQVGGDVLLGVLVDGLDAIDV